ncbi:MAG: phosphatidate cytidylyltransferase [Pseudomonadota bacterium]|nr:phosphatidate cytidylyltransferase [Pseudomonadota bacterium]
MLLTRIATAVLLIGVVLAALFFMPPMAWALSTLVVIGIGAHEWSALMRFSRAAAAAFVIGIVVIGLWLVSMGRGQDAFVLPRGIVVPVWVIATLFWLVVVPPWLHARWRMHSSLLAALVGGLILLAAWLALVQLQAQSPARLLAAMAVVWIADTAAYFAGRAFGKRKLAPEISPGKSWEGVFGGIFAVMLYVIIIAFAVPRIIGATSGSGIMAAVLFAMAIAAVSVCGDLFESLQKRQAGVKDSGHLLPGHGGVLDRIDALLAAMPPIALASALLLP